MSEDSGKRIILVLDNCQDLFEHMDEKFKELLHKLLDECQFIQILVVSRTELIGLDQFEPCNVQLNKIKSTEDAIKFFETKVDIEVNGVLYDKEAARLIAKTDGLEYLSDTDQQEIQKLGRAAYKKTLSEEGKEEEMQEPFTESIETEIVELGTLSYIQK